jgi:hypothetical protein
MRNRKVIPSLIFTVAISGGFSIHDVQASSVSPSELFVNDPAQVLMVDGKDRHSNVSIRVRLDTPNRSAFDFGFIRNDGFLPITGKSRKPGDYTFAGGSIVDFALRNKGSDGLFGTDDDLIYRLSDSAGYASQHYFAAIDPARSRHPVVTESYYQNLTLNWDLNLDGLVDAHALLKIRGSQYDGMMPAPVAVSLPGASWLLGSGLAVLGVTARRRKRPA